MKTLLTLLTMAVLAAGSLLAVGGCQQSGGITAKSTATTAPSNGNDKGGASYGSDVNF